MNNADIVIEQTSGTLINSGTLYNNFGTIENYHTLVNNVTLINNPEVYSVVYNGPTGTLTNLLTFNNSGQFVNVGTINNLTGAVINNLDGGILDNTYGGVLNNFYLVSNSAHGTILNELGATLNNEVQITNFGTLENRAGATLNNDFLFNGVAGSTLTNGGTFTNNNTFITNGTTNNDGVLQNQSGATLQNFGVFNNSASLSNSGLFQVANGGILNNTGSIGNTSGGGFVVQTGGTFNNSGSFLSDYLSSFGSQSNSTILNTGDLSLGGNTVAIGGSLRNNGTITMVAGPAMGDPAIQPPAPPLLITSTGKLSGTGTVNQGLFGFGVINQGVMAPGDPLGAFSIIGNYQQTATGTLDILLGGTGAGQFGQLDITGAADLGGALDVELFAGFDPQAGEIFEILESGGITNLDFLSMLFPTLTDGLSFKLDREGNNLFLDVTGGSGGGTSVPEPGTLLLLGAGLASMLALRRKKNVWAVAARATILVVTFMCLVGPAAAQNTWMSAGHPIPLWSNAGAWSLNVVPDGSTDISIPNGTVGGDVSFTNRNTLTIGAPATLTILSPTTITNSGFSGFIVNGGSLVNNGALVNASSAALNNGGTLTNNATLFNEIGAQLNNAGVLDNFGTFDNRVAGFVVNTGNLNNQSGGLLINDLSSTIENDRSIANEAGATLSNSGTINGSGIFVNLGTVDNSGQLSSVVFNLGGTINNTGGSIRLGDGSDIVGGTLGGAAGTVLLTGGGATATLDGSNNLGFGTLTVRGTYTSDVGTTTNLLGTINNQGNIQVNSGGLDTNLALIGPTTLQGGGTVTLSNNGGGRFSIVNEIGGTQTLINVDNTIQGTGVIDPIFVNQAAGTVNANVSGQTLDLLNGKLTNAGLLEATGGGVLFIKSTDVVNAGGTIAAVNGGIVSLVGGSVQGGLLNNVSGTLGTLAAGNVIELDGSTAAGAVTIRGTYTVDVGSTTILLGAINNQGNIQVNSGGLATHLALMGDTTLQGGGTVTLANSGGGGFSDIGENGNTPLTLINVDNTIQGAGAVDPILVNQAAGTVNANVTGQMLELLNGKLTNAGLLEATGGGVLFIKNTEVINAGEVIAAFNGTIDVASGTLTNSGIVQVNAGSTLLVNTPFTQTGGKTQIDGSMTLTQGRTLAVA